MAPSPFAVRSPRLCTAVPSLPDRDAVGAGLLVSLAGCGFDGQPCVGLKIREDNRDVRIRRARGLEVDDLPADDGARLQRTGAVVRRGIIGDDEAIIDGRSRVALFGMAASMCCVMSCLSTTVKVR